MAVRVAALFAGHASASVARLTLLLLLVAAHRSQLCTATGSGPCAHAATLQQRVFWLLLVWLYV
jgi:hypothetical protein